MLKKSHVTSMQAGTMITDEQKRLQIKISRMTHGGIKGYLNFGGGCMTLNVMHILFNRAVQRDEDLTLVVTGSDFIYKPGEDNFFYGKSKCLNPHVHGVLEQNNPDLKGINADPMRFGDFWLHT